VIGSEFGANTKDSNGNETIFRRFYFALLSKPGEKGNSFCNGREEDLVFDASRIMG
jgi:hypothetical protein